MIEGSTSQAFFGPDAVERFSPWETLTGLFDDQCDYINPALLIRTTHIDGIHVLPASQFMATCNASSSLLMT